MSNKTHRLILTLGEEMRTLLRLLRVCVGSQNRDWGEHDGHRQAGRLDPITIFA